MKLNVLSLFDGISCGMVALERAGIKVDKYYASEVDKNAIKVSEKNYPNIIRLGDVTKWREWNIDWLNIGMLIGGSPCQGFSIAGRQLNFDDPRSKLFFIYAEILEHIRSVNPNIMFLLENVKMKKECQDVFSSYLRVRPIEINSTLVSAQLRPRLYWTNIQGVKQPQDKGIVLNDVLQSLVSDKYRLSNMVADKLVVRNQANTYMGLATYNKAYRVMYKDKKSVCLDTAGGGGRTPYIECDGGYRKLTPVECERLQTLPDNYTEGIADSHRYKSIGNGWTVDVITHIFSGLK